MANDGKRYINDARADTATEPVYEEFTSGSRHSYDQAQKLIHGLLDSNGKPKATATTAYPRFINDNPDYTAHSTGGAVLEAELVERSWTEGDVDGCIISCWGPTTFSGVYVTLASSDIGTASAALRLQSTSDNGDRNRYWVANGESVRILFQSLTHIWVVAIDSAVDNNIDIVPI